MSADYDEEDLGPGVTVSDHDSESASTIGSQVAFNSARGINGSSSRASQLLHEVQHNEAEGETANPNGNVLGRYRKTRYEEEEEEEGSIAFGEGLASPTGEGLSSADGSISIPDDTPSIPVNIS